MFHACHTKISSKEELDKEYQSLQAVDDLPLDDLTRLEDDQLYSAGMKVVQEILHEMSVVGRTRRAGTSETLGHDARPESSKVGCSVFCLGKLDANKPRRSAEICPLG